MLHVYEENEDSTVPRPSCFIYYFNFAPYISTLCDLHQ